MKAQFIKTLQYLLNILEDYRWWIFGVIYALGVGVYYVVYDVGCIASLHKSFALFAISIS